MADCSTLESVMDEMVVHKKKWLILFVTTGATAPIFLDQTIMPVALPVIQKQFALSDVGLLWIVNTYLLALMSLLLIGGRLADIFGSKPIYLAGLLFFALASILGGMSLNPQMLFLARSFQGAAASLTMPTTAALLIKSFPAGQRARAIGINVGISAIFLALGPAIGGFLTEYYTWRYIFWINLPILAFAMIMSLWLLDWKKNQNKEPFHFLGAFLFGFSVIFFVVAIMQGNNWGWNSLPILSLLILAPICGFFFIFLSSKETYPLIDFGIFSNRAFTGAVITIFLTQAMVAVTVFWAIYLQKQLGYSPVRTGSIILVSTLPVFLTAPFAGFLADRFGFKFPIIIGFIILIFSLLWIMFSAARKDILMMAPGLLGFGTGIPMIFSPAIALALSNVPPEKLGASSAVTNSARQLAATIGISMMTALDQAALIFSGSADVAFAVVSLAASFFALCGLFVTLIVVPKSC